jgi:fructose-1,6-bisphosphatase/inositol monophosphatase family enzyme
MFTSLDSLLNSHKAGHLAWECAQSAGAFLKNERPRDLNIETKSSGSDLVSEMDRGAEALIVDLIIATRPNDSILGEEGSNRIGSSGVRWIIDPLDGTTNYLFGIPLWGVSIGVEIDGVVQLGVIAIPETNKSYVGVAGVGSFCVDGESLEALNVRRGSKLKDALLATGFGYSPIRRGLQAEVVASVLPQIADIRRSGCAVVDLCWLASGFTDGYFEVGLNPWDYAAGALIVSLAGGRVEAPIDGDLGKLLISSNPEIYDELEQVLMAAGAHDLLIKESQIL